MHQRPYIIKRHKIKIADPDFLIFTNKELLLIIIFVILGSFISFVPKISTDPAQILARILIFFIIIVSGISIKKIIAPHYAIKIEHKTLELYRIGFYEKSHFKKPFPVGLVFPFFLSIFSIGYLKPFTFFQFDSENMPEKRILKQHGQRRAQRKEVITEEDLGYTSASGFYILLLIALIGFLIKPYFPVFGADLTKYSIYFGLWNLLPFSQLDGTKLFFGTTLTWFFITIIYFISFLFIIL